MLNSAIDDLLSAAYPKAETLSLSWRDERRVRKIDLSISLHRFTKSDLRAFVR